MIKYNAKQQSENPFNNKQLSLTKLGAALLATSLVLSGCQPKPTEATSEPTAEETSNAGNKLVISPEAEATIQEFEAEFIQQMINLQESQQAEYEALQAADAPDMEAEASQTLSDEPDDTTDLDSNTVASQDASSQSDASAEADSSNEAALHNQANATSATSEEDTTSEESAIDNDNQATDEEVTAVTLQDLPLATNVVLVEPQILTAQELSNRYNTAMQSLYLPEDVPLPAQAADTLLNVATLTPKVFSNPELAQRLTIKSPALARFLKQYQTWEQAEIEHSEELEAIKQAQLESQQKQGEDFDALAKEFAAKIEEYDEQIAKYEKMLEEME